MCNSLVWRIIDSIEILSKNRQKQRQKWGREKNGVFKFNKKNEFLDKSLSSSSSQHSQLQLVFLYLFLMTAASRRWKQLTKMFYKKAALTNFTIFIEKHLCLESLGTETLLKKTPTQVLSCEYREVFKKTYFKEQLLLSTTSVTFKLELFRS